MNELIPFVPIKAEGLKSLAVSDVDFQKLVLEEAIRWAKHCGHYPVSEGLESYMELLFK